MIKSGVLTFQIIFWPRSLAPHADFSLSLRLLIFLYTSSSSKDINRGLAQSTGSKNIREIGISLLQLYDKENSDIRQESLTLVPNLRAILGTFRSEDEDDYEYEFSVLCTRTSKNVGLQTLCACSVRKPRTRSRPRPPI